MKKFFLILLVLLLALSLFLGIRACRKPEETTMILPFSPEDVETVELFHYDSAPADAQKKLVTDRADIESLYETLSGITCLKKETEALAGSPVTSFRFRLADGTDYELIYVGYGVKNGEIMSSDFRCFTSADIGWQWYYLNEHLEALPAEQWELPTVDGYRPTKEPVPVPTVTEAIDPRDAILHENGKFWDRVYGEVTLSEYCEKFYEDTRIFAVPLKAAFVDMDNDWTDELAVVITELDDTLILHIQDGRVVGQEFPSVSMEELKEDGTFRWKGHRGCHGISVMEFSEPIWATRCIAMENPEDEQVYYINPENFPAYQDTDPEDAFQQISEMQDGKPDAAWFDLPHGPIPTAPPLMLTESQQALVDVVMQHDSYFDLDKGEMTSPLQFLNDFSETTGMSVNFLKQAAIDFDGDGEAELALWIRVGDFNDYGLLVLHYDGSRVEGRSFPHRQMGEPKTDGTFHWSGSAGYNGVSRLRFGPDGWEQEVLFQVDYNMDTASSQYMVDGAEATQEEFDRAMDQQNAKEDPAWVGMENTLELFR